MRQAAVASQHVYEPGLRLTGAFHLAEDQSAMRTLAECKLEMEPLDKLLHQRRVFRGPIFKRIYAADNEHGRPYVSAKDLVKADIPQSRFLSNVHGALLDGLTLRQGMILVTCSGMNLGRAIWTRRDMDGLCATHDLLRIEVDPSVCAPGFVFAYLAGRYGHASIRRQIYGGNIKHIEPHHVADLPVPRLGEALEREVHELVEEAAALRVSTSATLSVTASRFDELIADVDLRQPSPRVSLVSPRGLQARMDAQFHDPIPQAIRTALKLGRHTTIGEMCTTKFLPGIFKRIHIENPTFGAPYYTGSALFSLDPKPKGILSKKTKLFKDVLLQRDTILVQAFGQDGGLTGRSVWIGENLAGTTTTHMLVRLRTPQTVRTAFLYGFLQSEAAYRQIAVLTYGGSIPHLDVAGISSVVVPLLDDGERRDIGESTLEALEDRDHALALERRARHLVESAIEAAN